MANPGELYWSVIEPYWDSLDIYSVPSFLSGYAALPEGVKHLICAQWCQSEVCNGGLAQFFLNSTGVLAPEAVLAFHEIGLPGVANIVQSAMEKLGDPYPRDKEERSGEMIFLVMPGVYVLDNGEKEDPNVELEEGWEWSRWEHLFDSQESEFFAQLEAAGGFETAADAYAARMA